ncbi:TAXI family TRAP transporter solute-binding subunit [Pararoseomonas indoligenes]|uniref:TAXI family TRAP transporter solute-binding subunit n=1 Tax=Roseomonas indoligenes TaxID=2820811 RepID=A0A940MV87_9PROT|nr:TAXI family TRAP transporter solute-binding subunit [Pararoseomonas indoligenes]MBP0491580.1 TAXI family TRAP transporter solute-binding subunit [Pararoseomonas indoligenes]
MPNLFRPGRRTALALAAALSAPAALAQQAIGLTLATATPGGGFPAYGDALIAALAGVDPAIRITPRNSAGSTENARLLADGAVDIALVAGEVATGALAGGRGLSVITAIYATPGLFVTRGDSPAGSIRDLIGKPIAWGAGGSGFVVLARRILGGLGLDIERDFQPVYLDHVGEGPGMVESGRVAALWGGGAGWPAFTAIASGPAGARFIPLDEAERRRAMAADPAVREMVLPADSYPHQTAPILSVGTWSYILARPGLAEETAYRLAAAIDAARPGIAARLPQGRETTPENTRRSVPEVAMIHPGTRRLLRERGIEG